MHNSDPFGFYHAQNVRRERHYQAGVFVVIVLMVVGLLIWG